MSEVSGLTSMQQLLRRALPAERWNGIKHALAELTEGAKGVPNPAHQIIETAQAMVEAIRQTKALDVCNSAYGVGFELGSHAAAEVLGHIMGFNPDKHDPISEQLNPGRITRNEIRRAIAYGTRKEESTKTDPAMVDLLQAEFWELDTYSMIMSPEVLGDVIAGIRRAVHALNEYRKVQDTKIMESYGRQ